MCFLHIHVPVNNTRVQCLTAKFSLVDLQHCETTPITVLIDDTDQSLLYVLLQVGSDPLLV